MGKVKRIIAADESIRGFFADTTDIAERARTIHGLNPVACAALGRLLSCGSMMGLMMKNEKDYLTVKIDGDGPMKGLLVTATASGDVKGYVYNNDFEPYARADGKLDVGGAVGNGTLTVIKDLGLKEPYNSTTPLPVGEIGEDLTYYFATSEQTPSSVGVGVLMDKETGAVDVAGGFIIQLMPDTEDEVIDRLEKNLGTLTAVTSLLKEGGLQVLMDAVLDGFDVEVTDEVEVAYRCDCSKEKVYRAIYSVSKADLQEMVDDGETIEVKCHFCEKDYRFTPEELQGILDRREHGLQVPEHRTRHLRKREKTEE